MMAGFSLPLPSGLGLLLFSLDAGDRPSYRKAKQPPLSLAAPLTVELRPGWYLPLASDEAQRAFQADMETRACKVAGTHTEESTYLRAVSRSQLCSMKLC